SGCWRMPISCHYRTARPTTPSTLPCAHCSSTPNSGSDPMTVLACKEFLMFRKFALAVASAALAGCAGSDADTVSLTGAGATFPYPVYSKWFNTFYHATGHQINYQSVGSGAGVKQYSERTVDFGATDGPMTDEEIASLTGGVIHV